MVWYQKNIINKKYKQSKEMMIKRNEKAINTLQASCIAMIYDDIVVNKSSRN